jgi:hypothetical protein
MWVGMSRGRFVGGLNCAGLGNQSCDVVLVKGAFNLGEPQGVGISEWETDGEQMGSIWGGMEMMRSV